MSSPDLAALVPDFATRALTALGEGACVVSSDGQLVWGGAKFRSSPEPLQDQIRRACQQLLRLHAADAAYALASAESSRPMLLQANDRFLEVRCVPFASGLQGERKDWAVAVIIDATRQNRLQTKLDAVNAAGRELAKLDGDAVRNLAPTERLKILQGKIVRYTRELMHFNHFTVRLLDKKSNKLEVAIAEGLPEEALDIDIYPEAVGNGISGYVAATGRSYICRDTEKDSRYITGLSHSRSSLTVPLMHNDEVAGIFNIESEKIGAFDEDDRQIAEIFGRYVALAMNILNLLVVERAVTSNRVMDSLIRELEEPLRGAKEDVDTLHGLQKNADLAMAEPLARVAEHVEGMINAVARAKAGPTGVTGAQNLAPGQDPLLVGKRILIADDDPSIRKTLSAVFGEKGAVVELCQDGYEACSALDKASFDMVISDIRMPYRNGYEIYAAAQRCRAGLPVVLMTGFGYDPSHSIVRASQEGLTNVLFKPFSIDVLLEEVCRALGAAQRVGLACVLLLCETMPFDAPLM